MPVLKDQNYHNQLSQARKHIPLEIDEEKFAMTRPEAEAALQQQLVPGTFIIRAASNKNHIAVSYVDKNNTIQHNTYNEPQTLLADIENIKRMTPIVYGTLPSNPSNMAQSNLYQPAPPQPQPVQNQYQPAPHREEKLALGDLKILGEPRLEKTDFHAYATAINALATHRNTEEDRVLAKTLLNKLSRSDRKEVIQHLNKIAPNTIDIIKKTHGESFMSIRRAELNKRLNAASMQIEDTYNPRPSIHRK